MRLDEYDMISLKGIRILKQLPKFLNATPHVRAARSSATRPVSRYASDTFALADARANVVKNKR
jgi:hypothetical protein